MRNACSASVKVCVKRKDSLTPLLPLDVKMKNEGRESIIVKGAVAEENDRGSEPASVQKSEASSNARAVSYERVLWNS